MQRFRSVTSVGPVGFCKVAFAVIAIFASTLNLTSTCARPAKVKDAERVPGWRIEQNTIVGPTTILVCPQGARMSWHTKDYVTVCRAPDFIPYMYSIKRKLNYPGNLKNWVLYSPHLPKEDFDLSRMQKTSTTWRQKPATRYAYGVSSSDTLKGQYEFIYQDGHNRAASHDRIDVIFTGSIKLTPPVRDFFAAYYKYPKMTELPVDSHQHYPNGSTNLIIETIKCEPTMISLSELTPPTGLTVTHSREALIVDKKSRKELPGVIEDLFGTKN